MARIEVDLDEFDTDEIIGELKGRIKQKWFSKKDLEELRVLVGKESDKVFQVESIIDQMKVDAFKAGMGNKSLDEIENFFK